MKIEISYGVILLCRSSFSGPKTLLIHQLSGQHWTFPKGHAELTDSGPTHTALREIKEELGLDLSASHLVKDVEFQTKYTFTHSTRGTVEKTNIYFLAWLDSTDQKLTLQPEEVNEAAWFTLEEASNKVTFDSDRQLIKELISYLQ